MMKKLLYGLLIVAALLWVVNNMVQIEFVPTPSGFQPGVQQYQSGGNGGVQFSDLESLEKAVTDGFGAVKGAVAVPGPSGGGSSGSGIRIVIPPASGGSAPPAQEGGSDCDRIPDERERNRCYGYETNDWQISPEQAEREINVPTVTLPKPGQLSFYCDGNHPRLEIIEDPVACEALSGGGESCVHMTRAECEEGRSLLSAYGLDSTEVYGWWDRVHVFYGNKGGGFP